MNAVYRWPLLAAILLLWGCVEPTEVVHLIPHNYSGPVIIEFGNPDGDKISFEPGDTVALAIPDDGVLRLSTSPSPAGRSVHRFYSTHRDGTRIRISTDAEDTSMQVFALVSGSTAELEDGRTVRWLAYVYGRPADHEDWIQLRGQTTSRALGVPGLQ